MTMLKNIILVGLGGAIGAILRYIAGTILKPSSFPINTFIVNVIGCFFIGIIFALAEKTDYISPNLKLFLATGICGGFTTFSSFSVENMALLKQGNYTTAALYIFSSLVFCIIGVFAGFKIINYSL